MNEKVNVLQHVNGLFYMELGLCGCGPSEEAFDVVRDLLRLAPFYDHRNEVTNLIGNGPVGHIVLCTLDKADLIEHGGTIHGSWLTDKGQWYLNALNSIIDWDEIDVGLPHNGGKCTDSCWDRPVPGQPTGARVEVSSGGNTISAFNSDGTVVMRYGCPPDDEAPADPENDRD